MSIILQAERSYRNWLRRLPGHLLPAAVLLHPSDIPEYDREAGDLIPQNQWPPPKRLPIAFRFFKGLPLYEDSRVPPGCVVLQK